jgi:hypothetical protein
MRRPALGVEIRNGVARCPVCPREPLSILWGGWPPFRKPALRGDVLELEHAIARQAVRELTNPKATVQVMECERGHRVALVSMAYRLLDRKIDGSLTGRRRKRVSP